jgi:hypothetical protein
MVKNRTVYWESSDSANGRTSFASDTRWGINGRTTACCFNGARGGEGKWLFPLTRDRAKPAVPFGANYRLIDFVLSNLVNAHFRRIVVLTQYKSHSLDRHLAQTRRLSPLLGSSVAPVPVQMRPRTPLILGIRGRDLSESQYPGRRAS